MVSMEESDKEVESVGQITMDSSQQEKSCNGDSSMQKNKQLNPDISECSPTKKIDDHENDDEEQCRQNLLNDCATGSEKISVQVFSTNPSKYSLKPNLGAKDNEQVREKQQKGCKRLLGIFLALVAALQFSLSALVIKILGYHPFNLGVWRFGVMSLIPIPFLIHATVVKKQNVLQEVWPVRSTTVFLMLQAILGANSIIFVFFGLKYLNIADSIVIGTSAPVFVTFFAFVFLGEPCGFVPVLTALLALVGVAIISKPPILTGQEGFNEETLLGVGSSFSSMILLTICYVVIRYLRKVHHALVNLCFALWGFFQSMILANAMGVFEVPGSFGEVGFIILSAFLAFFAQTCITLALKYEQAGPVALVRTSEVIFAFIWQAIFLGVEPSLLSVVGAVVTLSGVVLTAFRKIVMSLPDDHKYKRWFRFLLF